MGTRQFLFQTTFICTAALAPDIASACGCFAPPTPAEPVIQAGERIAFAHDNGKVIAHIEIQYQGDAKDFAWMLPTPAQPEFRLGSEMFFDALNAATRPQFLLTQTFGDGCGGSGFGCASAESGVSARNFDDGGNGGVAVEASTAGPYDYAILRADEKQPMLDWLNENGYFIPASTTTSIDPYIRPGAFFLVLKLNASAGTGDLQPVVVEYESERPMIPIVLTSMGATKDMGIIVWVLGKDRAIPHNYQHVVINEEYVDWANQANNYGAVVSRAIDEAEDHHAFVTEYAGTNEGVASALGRPGDFGSQESLAAISYAHSFVSELEFRGIPGDLLRSILQRALAIPDTAFDLTPPPQFSGITVSSQYYDVYRDYAQSFDEELFDSTAVAQEIWMKIIEPTIDAIELLDKNTYVTRMYTTLDPEEMTEDPVFAFNPDLPEVSNVHNATQINHCDSNLVEYELSDGRVYQFDDDKPVSFAARDGIPFAERIEVLPQEGDPQIIVNNSALLAEGDDLDEGGCNGVHRRRRGAFGMAFVFGLILVGRQLMRRRG